MDVVIVDANRGSDRPETLALELLIRLSCSLFLSKEEVFVENTEKNKMEGSCSDSG